jgi:hypothetical protein
MFWLSRSSIIRQMSDNTQKEIYKWREASLYSVTNDKIIIPKME